MNKITIFCEEKIINIIRKWQKNTASRLEDLQTQIENLSIGGVKFFGHQQWMQIQLDVSKFIGNIKKYDEEELLSNLASMLSGLDAIYSYNLLVDNLSVRLSNMELLKTASIGSTRSIEDRIMDASVMLLKRIYENEMIVKELFTNLYSSVKVSAKLTNFPTNIGGQNVTVKYISDYLSINEPDKLFQYKEQILNSCFDLPEHLPDSLPLVQKLLYGFNLEEIDPNTEVHYYLGLKNSMNLSYKIHNLVDADYAAENGGIGNMHSSMKINLVKRLNTIKLEGDANEDLFTQAVKSDLQVDELKVSIGNKKYKLVPNNVNCKWYPFSGAKFRLLKYLESTEAIILSKIEKDREQGWTADISKENDIMLTNIQPPAPTGLLSLIQENAAEYFNEHLPETDDDVKKLIIVPEIKSDHFIFKSVFALGMKHIEGKELTKYQRKEFAQTQLHQSLEMTTVLISNFRKYWKMDPAYDSLLSVDAKQLNFTRRIKETVAMIIDTTKLGNCYLYSIKNFAVSTKLH